MVSGQWSVVSAQWSVLSGKWSRSGDGAGSVDLGCARKGTATLVDRRNETGTAEGCGFGVVFFLLPEVRILLYLV